MSKAVNTQKEYILDMDATQLAKNIHTGRITSVEATEIYIEHLQHINPIVHCLVEERFDLARDEAHECDRVITEGNFQGKLYGVPVSVKETFHMKGMKTTGGLMHRKAKTEEEDSKVVRRLKLEGAVILGKTNTSTVALTFESDNKLNGRTNNPWDPARTAGGSSGGEAALIACGGAAVGVGSDIAGSLRLPAHFNGTITLKSGFRQISTEGHFPPPDYWLQELMFGIGALSKTVDDAELIHKILSDDELEAIDPARFQVFVPRPHNRRSVSDATRIALDEVRDFLQNPDGIDYPDFFTKLPLIHLKILTIDGAKDVLPLAFNQEKFPLLRTMLRELTRGDTDYYYHFMKTMMLGKVGTKLFRTRSDQLEPLERQISKYIRFVNEWLDHAVLVLPVFPDAAWHHGELDGELYSNAFAYPKWIPYTIFPNVLGLPALSVPVAEDHHGMPISVQLISRMGNEKALFYYGRMLEEHFRGYKRARNDS